ncbi:MAG: EAL domain-containing protein [Actinomycetota bacterium]
MPQTAVRRRGGLPGWAWPPALAGLLALAWGLVHLAGGTQTAAPHLLYLPIVLAALPYRRRGGLVVAVAATVLAGPLMPLDVASGQSQEAVNWLTRGLSFVAVGLLAGSTAEALHRSLREHVSDRLADEVRLARAGTTPPGPEATRRVRAVLDTGAFHPVFQPLRDLTDGRLLAVEALTRFDAEPRRPPNLWFEEAAGCGLGAELELAAMAAALDAAAGLPRTVALHLNASPATVVDPRLLALLAEHPRRRVVVEITEHAVVEDYRTLAAARERLRAHGVRLAIDDTGAGFASLRHVVRLEPDVIKLDMSLVHEVASNAVSEALAEALAGFAQSTGTVLVAEGVEDESDVVTWRRLGADAGQGYHLGAPGPLSALLPSAASADAPVTARGLRD